jgi:hypothetical protein
VQSSGRIEKTCDIKIGKSRMAGNNKDYETLTKRPRPDALDACARRQVEQAQEIELVLLHLSTAWCIALLLPSQPGGSGG